MNILIQNNKFVKKDNLNINFLNKNFKIKSDQNINSIKINNTLQLLYIGDIFFDKKKIYTNLKKLVISEFKKVNQKKILLKKIKNLLNGRYLMILLDNKSTSGSLFSDKYGRFDCFYHKKTTNLKLHQI